MIAVNPGNKIGKAKLFECVVWKLNGEIFLSTFKPFSCKFYAASSFAEDIEKNGTPAGAKLKVSCPLEFADTGIFNFIVYYKKSDRRYGFGFVREL